MIVCPIVADFLAFFTKNPRGRNALIRLSAANDCAIPRTRRFTQHSRQHTLARAAASHESTL